MSTHRRLMTAMFCALAMLANGTGALAQTQQKEKQLAPPAGDVMIERQGGMMRMPGVPPDGDFFTMQIAPPPPGADTFAFSFVSSEMNFDSKVVKGAPYSAEAVSESVQVLADGNRIVRKSTATLYRDGEGRTRRDQTLNNIGPWATADVEPQQTIFINDPVAGANYILNARNRTAQKLPNTFVFMRTPEGGQGGVAVAGSPKQMLTLRSGTSGSSVMTVVTPPPSADAAPVRGGRLANQATKRVQPVYPPIAKAAGAQGAVAVEVVISEEGEVTSARAVSGHPLLQQAAVDAAKEWRFVPTKLSGNPVKVTGTISFNFVLPPKEDNAPPAAAASDDVQHERLRGPQPVTESLGKQMIEGVEAEGTRVTVTFPAGMMGNERPISVVSERWYSPELQTVVMTKHSDPRFGENTYRLTNINRGDPAHNLFEVPSDYTLKEGPPAMPRQLRRKMPDDKQ
ncbi:MAG TPA: energy transducer TonB [Pyrinomonadaceae bacterium]|nr:energy transducer TonB [Pyrinomonadaceae bacterium]